MANNTYLGIDIGGTSIKYGIVRDTQIIERGSYPTPKGDPDNFGATLRTIVSKACEAYGDELCSIGVGMPGFFNQETGVIWGASNLNLDNFPMRDCIQTVTDLPVYLGNDANCAALGEYTVNPRKPKNMVMLTLGTGVGGGMVLNGELYTGSHGIAGELGHMVIERNGRPCSCGKKGCFEAYASATALVRTASEFSYKTDGALSHAVRACREKGEAPDARVIFEAVREGDTEAAAIVDEYGAYLAEGIQNYVEIFDPDEVVLAGGITYEVDVLEGILKKHYHSACPVSFSQLKNDAGLVGAASLGKNK